MTTIKEKGKCQHGVDIHKAEKGGCAICTTISKNLERDNSIYKKPSAVTVALRDRNRQSRKEATKILEQLAEATGHTVPVRDWERVTYYDLKHIGISFKDIEFLMKVKMDISAREWYEPSQKEIWWLRDINERVQKHGEDEGEKE